jgi:hypothetical protein
MWRARRWRRTMKGTLEQRFWSKVNFGDGSGCWQWMGAKNSHGYGAIKVEGRKDEGSHRVAYKLYRGDIPDGLGLDHICHNRACVRPDHLEAVTTLVNTLRGVGPSAQNARKQHCQKCGNSFSVVSFQSRPKPYRICKSCYNSRAVVLQRLRRHSRKRIGVAI